MVPRCKECRHCELRNRAESKFTGGYGYGRGYFFCENQETKRLPREAFGNQMPSFIGFGTPEYDTKLTMKTSPRWCPRRKKRMKQNSAGQFSQCNRCGARIMWVKTKAGKNMPVDPQFVDFKKIKGGKERLVLPNGEVVAGERCKAKEADGYGYISHFATCPGYRR